MHCESDFVALAASAVMLYGCCISILPSAVLLWQG